MTKPVRAIVTGAGSVVGQGIVKALRLSSLPCVPIAADIGVLNAGLYRADEAILLPAVEAPGALDGIVAGIRAARADVVFIGSEFDLRFYSEHREEIEAATGAVVIVSTADVVAVADDKYDTAVFLHGAGVAAAHSLLPSSLDEACAQGEEIGFPLILKSRSGTSSRNVHTVADGAALRAIFNAVPQPMLQEMLVHRAGSDSDALGEEYSCSIFRDAAGGLRGPFVGRRILRGGSSWIVESCRRPEFDDSLLAIGKALKSRGSLNIQLINTPRGPVPFELNARSSGTTAIRAHFGFNEPEMAIRSFLFGESLAPAKIRSGLCLRYEEEIFLDDIAAAHLVQPGDAPKGVVHAWF